MSLDDAGRYPAADPSGLRDLLAGFADQVRAASRLAAGVRLPGDPPRTVVVLGMGGSAAAGDLLQGLWRERASFPVEVVGGYPPPAWVGPDTVVVASSYSGGTEETLAAVSRVRARGARILAITSGGVLAETAERDGLPLVRIPGGFPPRAALAYLLVPVLSVFGASWVDAGRALAPAHEVGEAADVLAELGAELAPRRPEADNAAKQLGRWLVDRTPVVYGTDLTAAVAYRWRTQFEENAKVVGLSGALPEMNHNAIEAWGAGPGGRWGIVLLRDGAEHERVARRADLTRDILAARVPTREAWARGSGRLARLLSLVHLGDWGSYYLALLRGVDPWGIPTLEAFKRQMAGSR